MKKLYTLCFLLAVCGGLMAQSTRMTQNLNGNPNFNQTSHPISLAAGDTLLYIPFLGIQVNATDAPNFNYATEDQDFGTFASTNMFPSPDFAYFYTLNAAYYHPWETPGPGNDTCVYAAATSWFDTPGQANNWMEMGPITVPVGGATLSWFVHTNPTYRDGYEVLLSTTGMSFTDFSSPPIYTRADCYPCTVSNGVDTLWVLVTATVPAGVQYIAFHHNANDQDVLYLDEILLLENGVGIKKNVSPVVFSMFPNPAKGNVSINVMSPNTFERTISIKDVLGKEVYTNVYDSNQISVDISTLGKGVYFVSVSDKDGISTQKLVVQ